MQEKTAQKLDDDNEEQVRKHFRHHGFVNPLTTNDAIWRRLTLAVCYQLVQSVLKIGFALAKKAG